MALQNAVKNSTHTGQGPITWSLDDDPDNPTPYDLTGATLSGTIKRLGNGASRAITGTLTVTDAEAGEFTWEYSALDTSTAGPHLVQFIATYEDESFDKSYPQEWFVDEDISE